MGNHSKRSPSQISRIIRCPGCIEFVKYLIDKGDIPAEETSVYADEGTMLHKQQERDVNGQPLSGDLNAEQEDAISKNRDFLLSLQEKHKFTWIQTETKTSLQGYGIKDAGGTADIVAGRYKHSLHILDWKFGQGVPVYVEKNEQLMDYLLGSTRGVEHLKSFEELWIHLAQPRLDYFGSYQCSVDELMGLINAIKNSIGNYDIKAGETQCFWCRGKNHCAKYDEMTKGKAITVFHVNDLMKENTYDFKLMAKALAMEPFFKKVFKSIRDHFNDMSNQQLGDIGMKRVAGRSNRKFVDDEQVVKYLIENYSEVEDIYQDPKLKSPAQMEKTIKGLKKDKNFQKLIIKPLGKPTIVGTGDKRPEYQSDAALSFAHLASKEVAE